YTLGASGGGGTDVRIGGTALGDRIIVAGGGGGAGYNNTAPAQSGGDGGGLNGAGGIAPSYPTRVGQGGTQTAGGARGNYSADNNTDGSLGQGGQGGDGAAGGGGGGGGYYGGGGGCIGGQMSGGGGGGSGYIGGVTNGTTAQATQTGFIANPITDGNGFVRITIISGGGGNGDVYDGNDLAIFNLLSPFNDPNTTCAPDEVSAEIELTNLGENDYDFSVNNAIVSYEIIDPRQEIHRGNITINADTLASGEALGVELMPNLPLYAGTYTIKAWVTSALDDFSCDDTLITTFTSQKIGLPIQEDFSNGIPKEFTSTSVLGNSVWENWSDASSTVQPDFGTAMIRFNGTYGERSRLSTVQMDLYQASDPYMEFYYYHDALTSASDYSNMQVIVTVNGVDTTLETIYLRDPQGRHGWTPYRYSLTRFTTIANACILIQFEALSKNSGAVQYIDFVEISSAPDATVSRIIVSPEPTVCSRTNRNISVEIRTTTSQAITFDNATELKLEINGVLQQSVSLAGIELQGSIPRVFSMVPNFTIPVGTTSMKAYFSKPVDNMAANDTAKRVIDISPSLGVLIHNISEQSTNLAQAGFENPQEITLTNTGNMELSNIGLIMKVRETPTSPPFFTAKQVYTQTLAVGATAEITFNEAYTVPWADRYQVEVLAYLICDSATVNHTASIQEYVNMTDLSIEAITNPVQGVKDVTGDAIRVSLRIKNKNTGKAYNEGDAKVGIMIKNESGNLIGAVALEELPAMNGGEEISYTFTEMYVVPSLVSSYHLIVYLNSEGDNYPKNDTVDMPRETNYVGILDRTNVSFTMEQNIPNPAKENTLINYSVPQDGEIVFHVYSVSGQLLYTQKENVSFGDHQIELDLSDYAAGIYFYSMEYKGQRLVKRMSIKH
ncbi:MAG: T9SS type A sorting domain-containing protein, partial [Bacteroidales bacterium]|nr:T9SS type A sorting domain-containing protein [Bacteroidales bacterium]